MSTNINELARLAADAEKNARIEDDRDRVWETLNRGCNTGTWVQRDDVFHVIDRRFEVYGATFRVVERGSGVSAVEVVAAKDGRWAQINCLADIAKVGGAA